jgi:hypothetical protein
VLRVLRSLGQWCNLERVRTPPSRLSKSSFRYPRRWYNAHPNGSADLGH